MIHRQSLHDSKSLKHVIQSGKLFDAKKCVVVAANIGMSMENAGAYQFVLIMLQFHRRMRDYRGTAEAIRAFRKSKTCKAYMKPQLIYAEFLCLQDYCTVMITSAADLAKLSRKLRKVRRDLPTRLRKMDQKKRLGSPPYRLVS
jgi:hypothetical protein